MLLFTNNATAALASGIGPSTTSITVASGYGALYPSPTGGNYFLATLQEGTVIEIVKVTARIGDVMTAVRAQEGTSATTFTTAAVFDLRMTAGGLNLFPQVVGTFSLSSIANGGSISGTTLTFGAADASNPGMVSTTTQTIVGPKTFNDLMSATTGFEGQFVELLNGPTVTPSAVNRVRFRSNNGVAEMSENGGDYKRIDNTDFINPLDYGADPTGATDSLAAFEAAIVDWYDTGRVMGRMMYIPPGDYQLTDTLEFPAVLGGTVMGAGRYTSRFIWNGPAGNDIISFNSSQHLTIQGFSVWGLAGAQQPRRAIVFDYNPLVIAASGNTMRDILCDGTAARDVFEDGVYLSDAYGNNSEMDFFGVYVNKFTNAGFNCPGTQQKALNFFGCGVNGGWDGVDHTLNGGKYGLLCGGSFQWFGGGIGSCRFSAFMQTNPEDPCSIIGAQSELCYSFYGGDGTSNPLVNNANSTPVTIMNCRIDSLCEPDPRGVIQYAGWGPLTIKNNNFANGLGFQTYIQVASNGQLSGVEITGNSFDTLDSVSFNPLIITSTTFQRPSVRMEGNLFKDSGGTRAYRNEVLDQVKSNTAAFFFAGKLHSMDLWMFTYTQFIANAASQTVTLQVNPQSFTFRDFRAVVFNYFARTGGGDITMRIGTTSGGDELLQDVVVSLDFIHVNGDNSTCYGDDPLERGTRMMNGSFEPNHFASSTVYVTLTTSLGTLGNGTTTNLTRGAIHMPIEYTVQSRFLT